VQGHRVLAQVVHELLLLQLLRREGGREQAAEVVRVALRLREGQALVVTGVAQQGVAAAHGSVPRAREEEEEETRLEKLMIPSCMIRDSFFFSLNKQGRCSVFRFG
jgi:hypothetical protein